MAETIKKYKVFLASPSDVLDERTSVKEVIDELNISYGRHRGISIELLRWQSHSAPGVSLESSQDVINNDIGDDYDLFIGMLWMHFGTPTSKASSGTEEEFLLAYERFIENNSKMQILFYFKNSTPSNLDQINIDQLQKVRNFRNSLGEKNLLWWEFDNEKNLQGFLRLHIPIRIDSLEKADQTVCSKSIKDANPDTDSFEELGILDYQDSTTEEFLVATDAMIRISDSITWVGGKIVEKTVQLDRMKAKKQILGTKELRNYLQSTALILNDFASRVDREIPIFSRSFEKGLHSFSQLLNLAIEDAEDATTAYRATCELLDHLHYAINSINDFLQTVSVLPRLEKELNKARNNVETKVSKLINELEVNYTIGQVLKEQFEAKYYLGD